MSKASPPVVPLRAPKHAKQPAPAALSQRGVLSAREMLPDQVRVRCARPLWVFYGRLLEERFIRQPAKEV